MWRRRRIVRYGAYRPWRYMTCQAWCVYRRSPKLTQATTRSFRFVTCAQRLERVQIDLAQARTRDI